MSLQYRYNIRMSTGQRSYRGKNTRNALERWRNQIYTHSDLQSLKYNKSAKQIDKNCYAPTRELKGKHHRTDCKGYHNGLINKAFVCRAVVTKHVQR